MSDIKMPGVCNIFTDEVTIDKLNKARALEPAVLHEVGRGILMNAVTSEWSEATKTHHVSCQFCGVGFTTPDDETADSIEENFQHTPDCICHAAYAMTQRYKLC